MEYYIASLKHTNKGHEHITFWGIDNKGYTPVVGKHIGKYSEEQAAKLNDGEAYIAVPCEVVHQMLSPEPCWKPSAKFYDQAGPVVENTKEKWRALIDASMTEGRKQLPKPEPFKGVRRAIFTRINGEAVLTAGRTVPQLAALLEENFRAGGEMTQVLDVSIPREVSRG